MNQQERAALRLLLKSATSGTWVWHKGTGNIDTDGVLVAKASSWGHDGAFIVAVRNALPALLDHCDRLEAVLAELWGVLCPDAGIQDYRALVAEAERLRAQVHDCPDCGQSCKACLCHQHTVEALAAENAILRGKLQAAGERILAQHDLLAGRAERVPVRMKNLPTLDVGEVRDELVQRTAESVVASGEAKQEIVE
jgi:hypothetical protein